MATTREDIAAYTAKAVADPRTLNKRLIIQPAKNVLTQTELVNLWESISGQQVSRQYMSAEDLQGAIKGMCFNQSPCGRSHCGNVQDEEK